MLIVYLGNINQNCQPQSLGGYVEYALNVKQNVSHTKTIISKFFIFNH